MEQGSRSCGCFASLSTCIAGNCLKPRIDVPFHNTSLSRSRKTFIENVVDPVILTMVRAANEAVFRNMTVAQKQMSLTFLFKVIRERLSEVFRETVS